MCFSRSHVRCVPHPCPYVFHQWPMCSTGDPWVPSEFYEFQLTFRELNKMFPVLYLYSIFSVFHVVYSYFLCSCFVPVPHKSAPLSPTCHTYFLMNIFGLIFIPNCQPIYVHVCSTNHTCITSKFHMFLTTFFVFFPTTLSKF